MAAGLNPPLGPPAFALAARAVRALTAVHLVVAGALFVFAVLFYSTEIILRGFFNAGIPEYYEFVSFAFIYVFMLGAAALYARNEDIAMEALYNWLPARAKPWLVLIAYASVAFACAVALYYCQRLIGLQWRTPTPLLRAPEAIKWIPLAIAMASILFTSLVEIWSCLIWINDGTRPLTWPYPMFDHEPLMEEDEAS